MRQDSRHVTACKVASLACGKVFTGLQPPDFADVCLLATGQLGLYPDRTFTGELYLAWLGAQRKNSPSAILE